MAKKKRLNKRVVAILIAVGAVMVLFVAFYTSDYWLPRDPESYARKAAAALEANRFDDAEKNYGIAIRYSLADPPKNAVYLYELARVEHEMLQSPNLKLTQATQQEKQSRMLNALRTAMRLAPKYADAQRLLCDWYWEHYRPGFLPEGDKLLQIDPNSHLTMFRCAMEKARQSFSQRPPDPEGVQAAVDYFNRALEAKPDEMEYWGTLIRFLQQAGRDSNEITSTFERSIERNAGKIEFRIEYANYLREKGNGEAALKQIDTAIQLQPKDIQGYLARADYFDKARNVAEARKSLEDALKLDESDFRVYRKMADLYVHQNQFSEAMASVRQGIQTVSDRLAKEANSVDARRLEDADWQMNAYLALLLLDRYGQRREDVPTALADVQQCLDAMAKISPNHVGRARVAGALAFAKGDLRGCVPLLEQAVQEDRGVDIMSASELVMALQRLEQPTRAKEIVEEELRRDTGRQWTPSLLLMMAELKMMLRDYGGADVDIATVLELAPGAAPAQNLKSILAVLNGDRTGFPSATLLSPLHVPMVMDRVSQLLSERRDGEAVSLLDSLHQKVPADRRVLGAILDEYANLDRLDMAEKLVQEAAGTDAALAAWLAEEIDLRKEKDPAKRFELLKVRVERTYKDPTQAFQKEMELWRIASQNGLGAEADRHLQAAYHIEPNEPRVVDRLFLKSLAAKDWSGGAEWAHRAAAGNLDGIDGRWYSARLAVAQQQWPQAIELLGEVKRLRPEFKGAQVYLADCYRANHEFDKAQAVYEGLLKLDSAYYPAVKGMVLVTADLNQMSEHDAWVDKISKLPSSREDEYVRREVAKLLERRADPNSLPKLIDDRIEVYKRNPEDLQNAYQLGTLFERALRGAQNEGRASDAKRLSGQAEGMYRYVFEKNPSKLVAARPLAEFYARSDRGNDLMKLLGELAEMGDVDKFARQILAGDTLSLVDPASAEIAYQQALEVDPANPQGHLAMARFLQRQGRWEDAVKAYQRYRMLVPADEAARYLLVYAQIQSGAVDDAAKAIAEMLAKDPSSADAMGLQGALALRQKRYADAEKAFSAVLQGNASNVSALLGRARVYLLQSQLDKSRKDLQSVRAITDDPAVTMEYAQVCQSLGDAQSAEMAYREVLSRQRRFSAAMTALADLYLAQQNWASLEQRLAEARAEFPSDPGYLLIAARMWTERKDLAKANEALGQAAALAPDSASILSQRLAGLLADKQYEKVIAEANDRIAKPSMTAVALSAKGRALIRLGKTGEGEAAFLAILKAKPTVSQAIFVAQQAAMAYPTPKAACEAGERWVRDGGLTDPGAKMFLGMLYDQAKDYAAASQWLTEARSAAVEADRNVVGFYLGVAYYEAKDFAKAEQVWLDVLRTSPNDLQVLNNLAYLYANDLKDTGRALPYAKTALELATGSADVVDTYGWVLVQSKRYAEAVEVLRRAVAIAGANAVFRYHLGYACEQDGRLDEALKQYDEALKLPPPGDESVRTAIQQGVDRVGKKIKPE